MVSVVPLSVFYATSHDTEHPPTNASDGDETTFWMTTGMFPQEIVFQFDRPAQITRIATVTGKVKSMLVYAAVDPTLSEWAQIDSTNLPGQPIKQQETHQLNYQQTSYGVKIVINKSWGQFAAIYLARVEGPFIAVPDDIAGLHWVDSPGDLVEVSTVD
jgi:heat shock protein beta-11